MASFVNVFIGTDKPLAAIVSEIREVLGKELSLESSSAGERYHADLPGMHIVAFDAHEYDVDRDMDFPRYSVQIDIGPLTEEQTHDNRVRDTGVLLARQINSRTGYATMVTWDLQRVVERCGS
jgi:hypothetical protein